MPTYEDVLSLAKRLPGDDRARLLVALSAMVATSPTDGLDAVEVAGTNELITAEEIAESEAALQEYRAGRDPGINAAALKHKTIALQQCPDDPIEAFIGAFSSNTPDWVDRHDHYLGQAFASSMDSLEPNQDEDR